MGLIIEDGKGSGQTAEVKDNRLEVTAVTITEEHHANHVQGTAYSLPFSQSPGASGDCIFFLKNTSDADMIIEGVTFGVKDATADDSIYFKIGDTGTRDSAVDLTPVNLNAASGNTAQGEFERGIALNDGTLSGGSEFERIIIPGTSDVGSSDFNFSQDLIIPRNTTFTIWVDGSGTGIYYITVNFYYHD